MGNFDIADFASQLIIYMVVWIFAVSAHEAAHAWTSYKFGDDTAYMLGRVTLNPVPHIDPIGTLLLPIIGFLVGYFQAGTGMERRGSELFLCHGQSADEYPRLQRRRLR